MLEESPVGAATQEGLAHRNVSGEVYDGVGSEVMELRSEEVQKTPEKGMGRQRKPSVDVGG